MFCVWLCAIIRKNVVVLLSCFISRFFLNWTVACKKFERGHGYRDCSLFSSVLHDNDDQPCFQWKVTKASHEDMLDYATIFDNNERVELQILVVSGVWRSDLGDVDRFCCCCCCYNFLTIVTFSHEMMRKAEYTYLLILTLWCHALWELP